MTFFDTLPYLFGGWAALTILIVGILVGVAWADRSREYAEDVQAALEEEPALSGDRTGLLLESQSYDPSVLADALVRAHRRSGDQRLLSVLYPDRPLEAKGTVVSLADRRRPYDFETDGAA